jgi:hypothetical protein
VQEQTQPKKKSLPSFTEFAVPVPAVPARTPRPRYSRPALAPNGQPWPSTSAYLVGLNEPASADGNSLVTVDNKRNSSDMLVKLFDRRFERPTAVKVFFLRAHQQFQMQNLGVGEYDIRYQDLDSGVISQSQPFTLRGYRTT